METPLGLFENALQVELELEAIWNGAVLSSTLRSEWYHPLAGLVKTMNRETGSTYLLTRVEPPSTTQPFSIGLSMIPIDLVN